MDLNTFEIAKIEGGEEHQQGQGTTKPWNQFSLSCPWTSPSRTMATTAISFSCAVGRSLSQWRRGVGMIRTFHGASHGMFHGLTMAHEITMAYAITTAM